MQSKHHGNLVAALLGAITATAMLVPESRASVSRNCYVQFQASPEGGAYSDSVETPNDSIEGGREEINGDSPSSGNHIAGFQLC